MHLIIISTAKLIIALVILAVITKTPHDRTLQDPFFADQKWTLIDAYKILLPLCTLLMLTSVLSQMWGYPPVHLQLILQLITSSIWSLAIYGLFHFIIEKPYRITPSIFGLDKAKLSAGVLPLNIVIILFLFSLGIKSDSLGIISVAIEYSKSGVLLFLLLMLVINVISPVFEELLWRGILYVPVARKVGTWQAIGLLSFVESLLHLHGGLHETAGHFLYGLLCFYFYKRSRSLYGPIILHIGRNLCVSRLVIGKALAPYADGRVIDKYYVYTFFFCGFIINAIWLINFLRKKLNSTGNASSSADAAIIERPRSPANSEFR